MLYGVSRLGAGFKSALHYRVARGGNLIKARVGAGAGACYCAYISIYKYSNLVYKKEHALRSRQLPQGYVHIFLSTGDDGPDQRGTRNSLHTLFATAYKDLPLFLFTGLCLKHQFHLAVQSQLRLCDVWLKKTSKKYKYFSSVATLCHTWRGHLAKLRAVWHEQRQADIGLGLGKQKAGFQTPPLAIGGRWASIDGY